MGCGSSRVTVKPLEGETAKVKTVRQLGGDKMKLQVGETVEQ